ncbi:PLP-dependent aminotransferase family protein [Kosakonia sp. LAM2021]|uniref:MocR-like pyridoxine biosynthesis transcription factor PdxR n=1 Tax=Kosakonia sp. LAM2021 TaxID=2800475 RepID=UPI00190D6F36|nr:PLP-dependent aminotransferase family protein [Kosakonia sp. LAM2021]
MNIPDDELYALLRQPLAARTGATRQRTLYLALRDAIRNGRLKSGSLLPGSRVLAQALVLSRNTVNTALEQLAVEGYVLRDRQGTRVATLANVERSSQTPPPVRLARGVQQLPGGVQRYSPALAFTPGIPAANYFPLAIWRRLTERVWRDEGNALLNYGASAGELRLRAAIARHLAISRGIHCDAEQIVITEGAQEALMLCVRLLCDAGDKAWVEEPSYGGAKTAFLSAGLNVTGIGVDNEGMRLDVTATTPRIIYTSPSHQYPLGQVMSATRRLALLDYAGRTGSWIIEDDYDSEFRYPGEPIPAMLGMVAHPPVVYIGTFSKTLFPSLRIGFMVMPPALAQAAAPVIGSLLRGGHRAEQLTLARFIEEGHYTRHLAAMRRLYRKRQAHLLEALHSEIRVEHHIYGGGGGLHLALSIPGIDDQALVREAHKLQLAPHALSRFWLKQNAASSGLVLGYGNTSAARFPAAVSALNRLIVRQQGGLG